MGIKKIGNKIQSERVNREQFAAAIRKFNAAFNEMQALKRMKSGELANIEEQFSQYSFWRAESKGLYEHLEKAEKLIKACRQAKRSPITLDRLPEVAHLAKELESLSGNIRKNNAIDRIERLAVKISEAIFILNELKRAPNVTNERINDLEAIKRQLMGEEYETALTRAYSLFQCASGTTDHGTRTYHSVVQPVYMTQELKTAYATLGVPVTASFKEVKKAYRAVVSVDHPDKHRFSTPEERAKAEQRFKEAKNAYELINKRFETKTTP